MGKCTVPVGMEKVLLFAGLIHGPKLWLHLCGPRSLEGHSFFLPALLGGTELRKAQLGGPHPAFLFRHRSRLEDAGLSQGRRSSQDPLQGDDRVSLPGNPQPTSLPFSGYDRNGFEDREKSQNSFKGQRSNIKALLSMTFCPSCVLLSPHAFVWQALHGEM